MYYFEVLKALHDNRIKYLIVGGLAVNLHGAPRVTNDIDIIVSFDKENLSKLLKVLSQLKYRVQLSGVQAEDILDDKKRTDWIENKNLKAFSFINSERAFNVVDILLVHPLDFESAFSDKVVKKLDDLDLYLVNMDDLITLKKFSGRPQDLSDIEILKQVKRLTDES